MGRRDWGGTVFVACLIALAGFLRDHTVPVVLLSTAAVASAGVVVWDVWGKKRQSVRTAPLTASASTPPASQNDSWLRRAFYEHRGRRSMIEELPPAERERILGVPDQRAAHESAPALPMDRPRAIKRGKDLLRGIEAEQITFSATPWNMATGVLLRNRTAEVERLASAAGSTTAVPTAPDGRPTEMDYARLIAYVKEVIDAMEDQ